MTQKFHKGDLVHVAADLGPSMDHFTKDIDAIVIGSYRDQYGGGASDEKEYTLHLKGQGKCSWYYEGQLKLIEANRLDLLKQWDDEEKAFIKQISNLDWIFSQDWSETKMPQGASIEALARNLGCTNMWGSRGEGFIWYENAMATLSHAMPFLIAKDKTGWSDYASKYRSSPRTSGVAE